MKDASAIPFEEFSNRLEDFFERVVREQEPVVIENGEGERAVLMPVKKARRRKRERTKEDYEAFLSAAGSWSDVDIDEFLRKVYESRSIPPRPRVEL